LAWFVGWSRQRLRWTRRTAANQAFAQRHERATAAACQEAEVPNANEATRQHMEQEPAQELIRRQGQESLLIMVGGVAPPKGDLVVGERDQAMIGDGHAMGVRAQVTEHLLGSAEGRLAVNHPIRPMELANQTLKESGVGESSKQAVKL
jgi:hypothetical protein